MPCDFKHNGNTTYYVQNRVSLDPVSPQVKSQDKDQNQIKVNIRSYKKSV